MKKGYRRYVLIFLFALPAFARMPHRHQLFPLIRPLLSASSGLYGQAVYTAEKGTAFTRLTPGFRISTLGMGAELGSDLGSRVDLRLFADYTNLTHRYQQSGFNIALNVDLANTGFRADFYPFLRFPFRITPGYLFTNHNQVRASLHAQQGATFTLNNVNYASDDADPVYGTGRLILNGSGFTATAGFGRIVSHTRKRFSYPFEAGVAFIRTPVAQFNLFGQVCASNQTQCQAASQFPTFADNLAAQVTSWNRKVRPFHIYPILEGGVSYSFSFRRRSLE